VEEIKAAITLFQIVTTADFWIGMGDAIMGIAEGFIAFLLEGIATLLEKMKAIPLIGDKIGKGAESVRAAAQTVRDKGEANRSKGADLLAPAIDKATGQLKTSVAAIGSAFMSGFNNAPKPFDTTNAQESMDKSIDAVNKQMEKQQADADKFNKEKKPGQQAPTTELNEAPIRKSWPAFAQTLMKIGGGGTSVGGGGTQDPILRENQKHTSLLQTIARNTALKTGALTTGHLATFGL